MQDAVLPILKLVTEQIPQSYDYDAIGFEILYDARDSNGAYDFEGREVLTAVIGRDDAFALVSATDDVARQEILDRSDLFVNGKEFAVALGQRDPGEGAPGGAPFLAAERGAGFVQSWQTFPGGGCISRCDPCDAAGSGFSRAGCGCRGGAEEAAGGSERHPEWGWRGGTFRCRTGAFSRNQRRRKSAALYDAEYSVV